MPKPRNEETLGPITDISRDFPGFTKGDRIADFYEDSSDEHNYALPFRRGTLLGFQTRTRPSWSGSYTSTIVHLQWDGEDAGSSEYYRFIHEREAPAHEARIAETQAKYSAVRAEISDACEQAAKLIRRAGELANSVGAQLGSGGYDSDYTTGVFDEEARDIVSAIDAAGWNSSSWNC